MARGRPVGSKNKKADKPAEPQSNILANAISFCAPGFKEGPETYATHAWIAQGWMTTYNGIIMYGHPIDVPISACPHFGKMQSAFKTVGNVATNVTQLSPGKLSIKGNKFKAIIPCIEDWALVHRPTPDNPISMLDSRMREGFELMKQVATKNSEHVLTSSILVDNGYMLATDRKLLVHYWHGIGFPQLTIPADFVEAVLKVNKQLVSFGYTEGSSLTFWFEDNSFIRTNLYSEEWPDVSKVLSVDWSTMREVPDGFFEGLQHLKLFANDQRYVMCNDNMMLTHDDEDSGASYEVKGLVESTYGIDVDRIARFAGRVTHIDYYSLDKTIFAGENLRGVCVAAVLSSDDDTAPEPSQQAQAPAEQQFVPPVAEGPVTYHEAVGGFGPPVEDDEE